MMLVIALMFAQDVEEQYREALYLEVDKGDLDKAIDLYRKVEGDGAAPEAIRAKSAFRLAWCLEKKGQKVDAERGYREVTTKYANQSEVTQKARERLDRLVSGNGAPVSMSERIAGLILELGGKHCEDAVRTLVLLGEPTIPALRQALAHKDPTLAGMAACALVQLEQDSGTYAALERGLREGSQQGIGYSYYAQNMATLIRRQEGYRKDFVEAFKKEGSNLWQFLRVLESLKLPELDGRLDDLLCSGPVSLCERIVRRMGEMKEERFLALLGRLAKAEKGAERALDLLKGVGDLQVSDVETYCGSLLALFPNGLSGSDWQYAHRLASPEEILRRCAQTWLRNGTEETRSEVMLGIRDLRMNGLPLVCKLFETDLDEKVREDLLVAAARRVDNVKDEKSLASVERILWKAAENPDWKMFVAEALWKMVTESHPRWEEIVVLMALHCPRAVEMFRGCSARVRLQQILSRMALEGKAEERSEAVGLLSEIGDDSRFEVLSKVALDEKLQSGLRCKAIAGLGIMEGFGHVWPAYEKLVKEKDLEVRRKTVDLLVHFRQPDVEKLLAPQVEDPDLRIRIQVVGYLAESPRKDFLDPLIKALKDSDASIRVTATQALGRTEAMAAVPHLIERLQDDDDKVRAVARVALEAIKKHTEEIDQWKKWYEGTKGNK